MYDDNHRAWVELCASNVSCVLRDARKMPHDGARAFVEQHLQWDVELALHDGSRFCSVSHTVRFTNETSADSKQGWQATMGCMHNVGWDYIEHAAELKVSMQEQDTKLTTNVFSSSEHKDCQLANRVLPAGYHIDFVEDAQFGMNAHAMQKLQRICGDGWSGHDALELLFAAAGVPYRSAGLEQDPPILQNHWLERQVHALCGLPHDPDSMYDADLPPHTEVVKWLEEAKERLRDDDLIPQGDGDNEFAEEWDTDEDSAGPGGRRLRLQQVNLLLEYNRNPSAEARAAMIPALRVL